MVKKHLKNTQEWLEAGLRRACGRISPGRRVAIIVGVCLVFAIVDTCIVVNAIYDMGRNSAQKQLSVDHIEAINLAPEIPADTLNAPGYERAAE